jgi:hypothetical protein
MAPRNLSDIDIMQRFIDSTEDFNEMRVAVARIETAVTDLVQARVRCEDHAVRLRKVENSTGKLWQTVKVAAWVIGTIIALAGAGGALVVFM